MRSRSITVENGKDADFATTRSGDDGGDDFGGDDLGGGDEFDGGEGGFDGGGDDDY